MTSAGGSEPPQQPSGLIGGLKRGLEVWEVITGLIAAVGTVYGFINASGGIVVILMTIGFFGLFAYITGWGVYFVMNLLVSALEKGNREITGQGALWATGLIWVGSTIFLVHYAVGGVPSADYFADYDSLGQFLFAAIGTAVLVIPLAIFWYVKGTKPSQRQ